MDRFYTGRPATLEHKNGSITQPPRFTLQQGFVVRDRKFEHRFGAHYATFEAAAAVAARMNASQR